MNEANFLNTLSEKKYISYYKWIRISIFIFFCTALCISIVHVKELYKIKKLGEVKKSLEERLINFDDFIKKKSNLEKYKVEVQKELDKMHELSSNQQRIIIFTFLTELIKILPEDLYLQSYEYDSKKDISLKGYCAESYIANDFVQKLNKINLVDKVKLEYLKYKEYYKEEEVDASPTIIHEFLIKVKLKKEN